MASLKKKFKNLAEGGERLAFDPLGGDQARLAFLPASQIERDPDQPRKDVGNIEDLKASIGEHGILQPCIVSIAGEDQYRLIAGERRFTAAVAIGLQAIPCIVRTIEEHRRLEVQLVENLHRKELNVAEEAGTFDRLMKEFGLSQRELARRLGKSPASINQSLRILTLPEEILSGVQTSEHLTRSVLLEISKLDSKEEQLELFERARKGLLTVKVARNVKSRATVVKRKARHIMRTSQATITLTFESEKEPDSEIILNSLREAIIQEEKNQSS